MSLAPVPEAIQRVTIARSLANKPTEQTARQNEYADYSQSARWKDLREDVLAAQSYCQERGDDEHLILHHLYYYKNGYSVLYSEPEGRSLRDCAPLSECRKGAYTWQDLPGWRALPSPSEERQYYLAGALKLSYRVPQSLLPG